ncbi:MAG: 1D-myo-inositol 2-acetamido-2-deoxy-alpha-D-glucopyranoside deacetylase [Pelotomaculum sp. PtaB.Bin104]|nr:MAG: 1D-myo-inositol 2-acetamido-2-deoxy-alpha-D-glucopyranoside deacetylase [Pelotomaculum sp. PtaB.Bin104]
MSSNVVVIAAHPDDEVLGCGGTIAKHVRNNDKVHVVILAEGLTSRHERRNREKIGQALAELEQSARKANKILGVSSLELHDFPDNRMDSLDLLDVVKVVENIIGKYRPEIIYTHHAGDVNIDHRRIHEAVIAACRPMPGCPVKKLLFFEVPSSTEWQVPGNVPYFMPGWFVNISETLDVKLKALGEYASEMRDWPHSRSIVAIKHQAHWRGASIGVEAAEAFMLGRNIE